MDSVGNGFPVAGVHCLPAPAPLSATQGLDLTVQRIVVRRYGPAALQTLSEIRHTALNAARAVACGDRIVMLSVAAASLVAGPLQLAAELMERPSVQERIHILGAADQITAALLTMALHEQGMAAVSLTWEQAGLTPQSVIEGAHSGELRCHRLRAAIEQHPVVVLASACGVTDDGLACTLDEAVVRLAEIALSRSLSHSG